jgi:hypothetical protein
MEPKMNTKLTINLKDGILDVNGSADFVRSIYEDFKGEVARRLPQNNPAPLQLDGAASEPLETEVEQSREKRTKTRRKRVASAGDGQKSRGSRYKPKFDPALDVNGLVEFYDALAPKNNSENILAFAMFLKEKRQMDGCTGDHIYTCFYTVRDRTKIPEAFEQAFRDAQHRTHYIQVNSMQDISVTIPGSNHFETMKKRKAAA